MAEPGQKTRRPNRGPGGASSNRAALIAAAREVFAEFGVHAPISRVARRAGVGQAVLYRHFPDRQSLGLAVFEENLQFLEALVARPETTFDDLIATLIDQLVSSNAFFVMVDPTTSDIRLAAMADRMTVVLASKLADARQRGTLRADLTVEDLRLGLDMMAAYLSRTDAPDRTGVARRLWALLKAGLAAPDS
ncbi:TetR/AcrR family transcriptional regulator [Nocardia sp. alder85J]|uniref:TetR/AcrR family transcriptional regulator n=1 Tax=Nocardia sp. alder85J TaxID=2862949 RepID=UPI001CD4D45B|nr:TetR/AcrR family transcriptional regulator [Nocardia sp. alder85J]MCX4094735.1 helix-turn-helix domain containing protein [Nocardia sp. alder85J]